MAAERREMNRIILLSEIHKGRDEQVREDKGQEDKRGTRGRFIMMDTDKGKGEKYDADNESNLDMHPFLLSS